MVGRAALNIAGTDETYFFFNNKYTIVKWKRGGDDTVMIGPTETFKAWHTLKEADFGWVDAVLPVPYHQHRAYFFCGNKYARIEYVPGTSTEKIIGGVQSIADGWPSLKQAGFSHIDGALMEPGKKDQAYFFCDDEYVRVRFKEGQHNDEIISGPRKITSGWNGIKLNEIDAIMPEPGSSTNAYAFSGDKYIHFNAVSDEIIYGPVDAPSHWKALAKTGFF